MSSGPAGGWRNRVKKSWRRGHIEHHVQGIVAGAVVIGEDADGAETALFVEGDCGEVGLFDFEVDAVDAALGELMDHGLQESAAGLVTAMVGIDGEAVDATGGATALAADQGDAF